MVLIVYIGEFLFESDKQVGRCLP